MKNEFFSIFDFFVGSPGVDSFCFYFHIRKFYSWTVSVIKSLFWQLLLDYILKRGNSHFRWRDWHKFRMCTSSSFVSSCSFDFWFILSIHDKNNFVVVKIMIYSVELYDVNICMKWIFILLFESCIVTHTKDFYYCTIGICLLYRIINNLLKNEYQSTKVCGDEEFKCILNMHNLLDTLYPTAQLFVMESAKSDYEHVPFNQYDTSVHSQNQ